MVAALGVGVTQANQKFKRQQGRTRLKNFASMPQLSTHPADA